MPTVMLNPMKGEAGILNNSETRATALKRGQSVEVCVPASTSNLGAGFDCFGLALQLYLTVRATIASESSDPCRVRSRGEGSSLDLPRTSDNLIYRAMCLAAERQGITLPPVRLAVHNEIPLGSGLGSSAAAIIAGLTLCALLSDCEMSDDLILRLATEMEGHADNVAATLYGEWVVTCIAQSGRVLAIKRRWPHDVKVIVVSPHVSLETQQARAALPQTVTLTDAVHNLQRAALLSAALEDHTYDLVWEAMQDRLHQEHRQALVPGLADALATPRLPGLIGLALSGAGPSVLALVLDNYDEIGRVIATRFNKHSIETTVRLLEIDDCGRRIRYHTRQK